MARTFALILALLPIMLGGCRPTTQAEPEPLPTASAIGARMRSPLAPATSTAPTTPTTPPAAPAPFRRTAAQARAEVEKLPEVKGLVRAHAKPEIWVKKEASPDCVGEGCWHTIEAGIRNSSVCVPSKDPSCVMLYFSFRVHAREDKMLVRGRFEAREWVSYREWVAWKKRGDFYLNEVSARPEVREFLRKYDHERFSAGVSLWGNPTPRIGCQSGNDDCFWLISVTVHCQRSLSDEEWATWGCEPELYYAPETELQYRIDDTTGGTLRRSLRHGELLDLIEGEWKPVSLGKPPPSFVAEGPAP